MGGGGGRGAGRGGVFNFSSFLCAAQYDILFPSLSCRLLVLPCSLFWHVCFGRLFPFVLIRAFHSVFLLCASFAVFFCLCFWFCCSCFYCRCYYCFCFIRCIIHGGSPFISFFSIPAKSTCFRFSAFCPTPFPFFFGEGRGGGGWRPGGKEDTLLFV